MLNNLRNEIHDNSIAKGFWEKPNLDRQLLLVITEEAEAVEAMRNGNYTKQEWIDYLLSNGYDKEIFEYNIKDTFEDEIADSIIRLLDICGHLEIDIDTHIRMKMMYNSTREKLHGKLF